MESPATYTCILWKIIQSRTNEFQFKKQWILNWKCLSFYVTRQLIWRQTPRLCITAGLKIMAGQRTMSGLIVGLTGQTLVWPVIFGRLLYNTVIRCFLWLFLLLCTNPFKEKRSALLWSVMRPSGKTYANNNPLFFRKLKDEWQFLSIKRFTSTCKRIVKITFDGIRANRSLVLYCFSGNKFQRID